MTNKILPLILLTLTTTAFAADEISDQQFRQAKERVSATFSDKRTAINGMNSVGIGNCEQFWVGKNLGLPVPAVVPRQYRGVVVGFATRPALVEFTKAAAVLGTTVQVEDDDGETVEVPLCAKYVGTIRAGG